MYTVCHRQNRLDKSNLLIFRLAIYCAKEISKYNKNIIKNSAKLELSRSVVTQSRRLFMPTLIRHCKNKRLRESHLEMFVKLKLTVQVK